MDGQLLGYLIAAIAALWVALSGLALGVIRYLVTDNKALRQEVKEVAKEAADATRNQAEAQRIALAARDETIKELMRRIGGV